MGKGAEWHNTQFCGLRSIRATRQGRWKPITKDRKNNIHDGETIGFTADDKRAITRSPGVGLPEEQMTLKISWEPGGDPDGSGENNPDGERPVR